MLAGHRLGLRAAVPATAFVFLLLLASCKPFIDAMNASAEANRTVTVVVHGAVIGPADSAGNAWDGDAVPREMAGAAGEMIATYYGVGEIPIAGPTLVELSGRYAAELGDRFNAYFAPPDSFGKVEVLTGTHRAASAKLGKNTNSYTPFWNTAIDEVAIHKSTLKITLWDGDLVADRVMAVIMLTEDDLLEIEEAESLFAFDSSTQTNGAIPRVLVSVSD